MSCDVSPVAMFLILSSLHTLLPPVQAFPGLQEVRYSSPETPPGSTPSPGSAYSTLPPAPLQLTSLEVTATELVWRGGTLHQQDQVETSEHLDWSKIQLVTPFWIL